MITPSPRTLIIAGLALVLILSAGIGTWLITRTTDKAVEQAHSAGQIEAIATGQKTTLEQIGAAHAAETAIRDDRSLARYCECLRSATADTTGNCVRYRPIQPVPDRSDDTGPHCPG